MHSAIYHHLRNFIRSNYFTYLIAGKFRNIGKCAYLATKNTDIVVEGFQRSGNTLAYHVVSELEPNKIIAHHTHSIINLKIASKYNIPLLVVIRNPLDSLVSATIYRAVISNSSYRESFEVAYNDYVQFYKVLSKLKLNSNQICVEFEYMLNHGADLVEFLNLIWSRKNGLSGAAIFSKAYEHHQLAEKNKNVNSLLLTIPSVDKINIRNRVIDYISDCKISEMKFVQSLYDNCRLRALHVK